MKKDFRQAFNLRVQHDEQQHKFYISLGGDEVAVQYEPGADNSWHIKSVRVPSAYRSTGAHARLLEYVLELARQDKITVHPDCAYARTYIQGNPRFAELIPQA